MLNVVTCRPGKRRLKTRQIRVFSNVTPCRLVYKYSGNSYAEYDDIRFLGNLGTYLQDYVASNLGICKYKSKLTAFRKGCCRKKLQILCSVEMRIDFAMEIFPLKSHLMLQYTTYKSNSLCAHKKGTALPTPVVTKLPNAQQH